MRAGMGSSLRGFSVELYRTAIYFLFYCPSNGNGHPMHRASVLKSEEE